MSVIFEFDGATVKCSKSIFEYYRTRLSELRQILESQGKLPASPGDEMVEMVCHSDMEELGCRQMGLSKERPRFNAFPELIPEPVASSRAGKSATSSSSSAPSQTFDENLTDGRQIQRTTQKPKDDSLQQDSEKEIMPGELDTSEPVAVTEYDDKFLWTPATTKLLISLRKSEAALFESNKLTKKKAWEKLAVLMKEQSGDIVTWMQLKSKWAKLEKN